MHDHDHDHHTHNRWLPLWQALLIGGIGGMLLLKVTQGTLPFYVHVRYTPLIAGTGVALILLALFCLFNAYRSDATHDHEAHHDHDHPSYTWHSPALMALLVPILLGLLVPAQALGSAAIGTRGGIGTSGTGMRTVESFSDPASLTLPDPTTWTLLDWVNATIYEPDNPRLQGQPIEAVGFVWRAEELPADQFMLSRFIVSCCTADGLAIGMPVETAESASLANDQWVQVKGTLSLQERAGRQEAFIVAEEVIMIEQPAEPYLYP